MNRVFLVAAALVAASAPSFGSMACDGTPTSISAIVAGGGCVFGSNVFTNFSIATSTASGTTPVDAINPNTVQVSFAFAGNLLNVTVSNSDTASWALTASQQFDLILTYTVTGALPAYFQGVGDSFNGSGTSNSNGAGAIAFDKTADGTTLLTLSLVMTSQAPVGFAGAPLSTFDVTDNIQVHATNASATLVNATNSFAVPEPMTLSLLGAGLLGIGIFGRRRLSK